MSSLDLAPDARTAPRARPLAWLRAALRGWGWRHTVTGLVLGSLALFNMGSLLLTAQEFDVPRAWVYNVLEFGLPGVLALRVADQAVADGVARPLAYGAAVLLVIGLGVWVIGPLLVPLLGAEPGWDARDDLVLALNLLLPFSLGTLAYAHWRRGRQTLARVQAAERVRAQAERELQAARLLALQARVDPQFLFDVLGRIDRLLDGPAGVPAAEDLLADLIAYLRALQPAAGATASTVAREFALVQAYGRCAGLADLLPPRLQLQADDDDAMQAPLAPMALLPVLRQLVDGTGTAGWCVRATTEAASGALRIAIAPAAPDPAAVRALAALDLAALATRLRAVHGDDAQALREPAPAGALLVCLPSARERPPARTAPP